MLTHVHRGAKAHCRGPSVTTVGQLTCPSGVRRFYTIDHTINNATIILKRKRSMGTIVHEGCPSTVHVTSILPSVSYTAFGPSGLSSPGRLSKASITIVGKRVNMTRGNTV